MLKMLNLPSLLLLLSGTAFAQKCFDSPKFSTDKGFIRVNGLPLVLKGINWFGAETETLVPHGLWSYSMDSFLDIIQKNNFNAIRVPFSLQMVKENKKNTNVKKSANPGLVGKTGLDVLEILVKKAGTRGILIMLDYHLQRVNDSISELWYDSVYTESVVINLWNKVLTRLGNKWNVFAIDLKNEPHGAASWGMNRDTDWNKAAERIIKAVGAKFNKLFFVEGVQQNVATDSPSQNAFFWGENLQGVKQNPVKPGDKWNKNVVYSPHVYGPDISGQSYFTVGNFPQNMPAIWDEQFGLARNQTGQPVVIGEWGGHFAAGSKDETWENALVDYLIDRGLTDQFYWCLNPNSGDTGGLLGDDWKTLDSRKAALLKRAVPNPTKMVKNANGKFCVTPGSYPNAKYNF